MFRQKFLASLALSLTALIAYAPAAQASCSCQCVEGVNGAPNTTTWACTTFLTSEPPPEGCPVETYCPVDPEPAPVDPEPTPVEPEAPVVEETPDTGDQVADGGDAEAPVSGLQCRYRKVYRPDEGKFKKVKVCRLSKEERAEKRAEWKERMAAQRAELRERLAEYRAQHDADAISRLRAKHQAKVEHWKEKKAKKAKNGKAGD